jgi:hypothetical protein
MEVNIVNPSSQGDTDSTSEIDIALDFHDNIDNDHDDDGESRNPHLMTSPQNTNLPLEQKNVDIPFRSTNTFSQQGLDEYNIETVQIDELQSVHPYSLDDEDLVEELEDKFSKKNRKKRKNMMILLVFVMVVLGLTIVISTLSWRHDNSNTSNPDKDFPPASIIVSSQPSMVPTTTIFPSFSPSCNSEWSWALQVRLQNSQNTSVYDFMASSNDGQTAIATYREQYFGYEAFFLSTLEWTDYRAHFYTLRHPNMNIRTASLTQDGNKFVVGVSGHVSDVTQEIGGAIITLHRVQGKLWIPLHYRFVGGGSLGVIFSIATNDLGTIHAVVAGSDDDLVPTYIQVYTTFLEEDPAFTPMGERFVDNKFNNRTLVGFSGTGKRLFIYSDDGIVRIFDYDGTSWQPWSKLLRVHKDVFIRTSVTYSMKVSRNGNSVALISSNSSFPSYVIRIQRHAWTLTSIGNSKDYPNVAQHGDFSADGSTVILSHYPEAGTFRKLFIYHQNQQWVISQTIRLPHTFQAILDVSINEHANRVVIVGLRSILVYDRYCMYTQSPAPSISSSNEISISSAVPVAAFPIVPGPTNHGGSGPDRPSSKLHCEFDFEPILNLSSASVDALSNSTIPVSIWENSTMQVNLTTSESSFSTGVIPSGILLDGRKLISNDGTLLTVYGFDWDSSEYFLEAYDLTKTSSKFERLSSLYPIEYLALSGQANRVVFHSWRFASDNLHGFIFVYTRKENKWINEVEFDVGDRNLGNVVNIGISTNGSIIAYAFSDRNNTGLISVFRIQDTSSLTPLGDEISSQWVNENTTISFVDQRLFAYTSDGLIRAYDLVQNVWVKVGQSIPHFDGGMFVPTGNKLLIAIVDQYFGTIINRFQSSYWIPSDESSLLALDKLSGLSIESFAISSDGKSLLYTVRGSFSVTYSFHLFKRLNDNSNIYSNVWNLDLDVLSESETVETTVLTVSGRIIVVTNMRVAAFRPIEFC